MEDEVIEKFPLMPYVSNFFVSLDTLRGIEKDIGKIRCIGMVMTDQGYQAPAVFLWEGVDDNQDKVVIVESQWESGAYVNVGFLHRNVDEDQPKPVARLAKDFKTYKISWS